MNYEVKGHVAIVRALEMPVSSGSDAMDLLATVRYETGCTAMVLAKACLDESFFRLSSGLAGEVLQKFVNYQMRLAIVGDYSHYTSKPLKDFIYESNQGTQVGFLNTEEKALAWLAKR